MSFLRETNGQAIGILGIARDVTERKRADETLRASEQKYRALFESKLDGVVVTDETMKPVLANQTAAEMLGYDSVEELLEVDPFDLIHPKERKRVINSFAKDMLENNLRQVAERLGDKVPSALEAG